MTRARALGYVRVSTTEQAVHGQGLGIQCRAIRDHCKAFGLALVDILSDQGISGASGLDTRQGLANALARIEDHEATVLVVYRLDRLARDLLLQETIMERLGSSGGSVVSVSEPEIDSEDPTRILVRQVLGALSQYEKSIIRARMLAGRRVKAQRGGFIGGIPKFGYAVIRGELVALKREQLVVARIVTMRAQGASLRTIGRALDAEELRPKRGERWHPTQVARILNRLEKA
jgi:DNA invertase Pin-like site-specific DNA recombinase